jgi:hypothetical protein
MQALFQTPKDSTTATVGSDGRDYVVFKVTKVERRDPAQDPGGRTQLNRVLHDILYNQMLEEVRQALYAEYDVKIYPQMAARAISPDAQ